MSTATTTDTGQTAARRTTAARAFQADRELLSATKLIFDTKHPSFRNVARVRSEASGDWRTETLPHPESGVRLLPQNKLAGFDARMSQFRQELLDAARELSGQYDNPGSVVDDFFHGQLDLRALGKPQITKASHVEPDRDGNWWAGHGASWWAGAGTVQDVGKALQAERG